MEKLKKCPFCGGELKIVNWHTALGKDFGMSCKDCGMIFRSGRTTLTEKEAIEICNTRKPMERIVERLEQQERQYNRRAKEFLTLGEKVYHEKYYAKACSYDHAIKIVKEEME